MYELCDPGKLRSIQQQTSEIKTLEEAIAELYNLFELTYILLNGMCMTIFVAACTNPNG